MKSRLLISTLVVGAGLASSACGDGERDRTQTECVDGRSVTLVVERNQTGRGSAAPVADTGYLLFTGRNMWDGRVAHVDPNGSVRARSVPAIAPPFVLDAVGTEDGGVILAGTLFRQVGGDIPWVAKLDADWQLAWERLFEPTPSSIVQLAKMPDGGVVIAGLTSIGQPSLMAFCNRLSPDGETLWERTTPVASSDPARDAFTWHGRRLTVSVDGQIRMLIATDIGVTLIESTPEGNPTQQQLDLKLAGRLFDSVTLPDGRLAIASTRENSADTAAVLTMVAANGTVEWEKLLGQNQDEEARAVAFNAAKNEILVGGGYHGAEGGWERTWIVAMDLDGNPLWQLVREPLYTDTNGIVFAALPGKGPSISDIAPRPDGSFIAPGMTGNLTFMVVGAEPCGS